ncbi:hypothetical protein IMG5_089360, partial [Ichthyophthirius multifiliis]
PLLTKQLSMNTIQQKQNAENSQERLPDLYMKKLKILVNLQNNRQSYPLQTNLKQGTNKPIFMPHSIWDKILKEVYWRSIDFKEENKIKLAICFNISKKMKKTVDKKYILKDQLQYYHKLIGIQFSSDLDIQIQQQRNDKQNKLNEYFNNLIQANQPFFTTEQVQYSNFRDNQRKQDILNKLK